MRPAPLPRPIVARNAPRPARAVARGVTLLEMLISAFVVTLIAITTLAVLGEGRALRERARHRVELALLAQGQLERLRATPPDQIESGAPLPRAGDWPQTVSMSAELRRRDDGFLQLGVVARRDMPTGPLTLELQTIHPGGRR